MALTIFVWLVWTISQIVVFAVSIYTLINGIRYFFHSRKRSIIYLIMAFLGIGSVIFQLLQVGLL